MATDWRGPERRRFPRAGVRLPAGIWLEGEEIRPGFVINVSAGGVRVETRRGLSAEDVARLLGQRVWLDFTDVRHPARVMGVQADDRVQLGLEFEEPTEALRELLARLIASSLG